LKARSERIAAPGDTRNANAGLTELRVVDGYAKGSLRRELAEDGAANRGKHFRGRETMMRGETVRSCPVFEQTAQREGFGAFGEALLGEGWGAFSPELVDG
jgi:hypothetical protein